MRGRISVVKEKKDLGGKKERNIREVIFWRGGLLLLLQKRERGEDKRLCLCGNGSGREKEILEAFSTRFKISPNLTWRTDTSSAFCHHDPFLYALVLDLTPPSSMSPWPSSNITIPLSHTLHCIRDKSSHTPMSRNTILKGPFYSFNFIYQTKNYKIKMETLIFLI